jgi:hypothetical protein
VSGYGCWKWLGCAFRHTLSTSPDMDKMMVVAAINSMVEVIKSKVDTVCICRASHDQEEESV